jgi:hypothetical protein
MTPLHKLVISELTSRRKRIFFKKYSLQYCRYYLENRPKESFLERNQTNKLKKTAKKQLRE